MSAPGETVACISRFDLLERGSVKSGDDVCGGGFSVANMSEPVNHLHRDSLG